MDAGVEEGDEVGLAYDPMVAKLIAHGPTRDAALDALAAALAETRVEGVTTNLPFLRWLVDHPVVRAARGDHRVPHRAPAALVASRPSAPPLPSGLPGDSTSPPRLPRRRRTSTSSHTGRAPPQGESTVTAPMPGTVIRLEVAVGDTVRARQPLVVLEAMKMEIPVHSPFEGTVKAVHVAVGDRIAGGTLLVELET